MKSQFNENGYILIKNMFSKSQMLDLLKEIHSVFRNQFEQRNFSYQKGEFLQDSDLFRFFSHYKDDYIKCMMLVQNSVLLYRYGTDEQLIKKIQEVGSSHPIFSTKALIFLNSEKTSSYFGNWKIPAHQDWRSIQGSLNSTVVWVPIVDCPIELGPLEVIPSSHKEGLLPSQEDNWYAHVKNDCYNNNSFIKVPMQQGDALIFSMFLLHRSGINVSNNIRYSFQLRYNDFSEPTFIERKYPNPYLPSPPQKDLITPDFPQKNQIEKIFK